MLPNLSIFIFATFASSALILGGELLSDAGSHYRLVSIVIQSIGTLSLVFLLPLLYLFISKEEGYTNARWGLRRVVFHFLSWLFYGLCISVSTCIGFGYWKFICQHHIGSFALVGLLALIASVFMISSLHEVEAKTISVLKSFTTRLQAIQLFLTMNVMLAIVASVLAVLAEMSLVNRNNKRLAAVEAGSSAALFILVLFNTHGLGGRLMHNGGDGDVAWKFFQPFVGGIRFIILQIASWVFFGLSLVFGFLFILSTFTIGMEIFLGVTAVAGSCCIISEILMIISICVFEKDVNKISVLPPEGIVMKEFRVDRIGEFSFLKPTMKETVQNFHGLLISVLVVNMQFLPFLGIIPVFFTAGLTVMETLFHWFAACIFIGVYTLVFAYFKARQFKKRINVQNTGIKENKEIFDIHKMTTKKKTGIAVNTGSKILPINTSNNLNSRADSGISILSPVDSDSVGMRTRSNKKKIKDNEKNGKNANGKKYDKVTSDSLLNKATNTPSDKIKVGDDFSLINNAILFIFNCFPLFATIYVGCIGSNAFGPWMVIAFFHFLYVGTTYRGAPEITGCREILEKRRDGPVIRHIGETVRRYFNGSIIKECDLDPKGLYILGFHPHGVVPITLFWLRCASAWEDIFPNVQISVLTASVMHLVPLMRDLLQWMGGREVSRESFRHALKRGRSCMVVPGGQAEMLQSESDNAEIRVITKHSGFIRMALQEGAHLVPIISFGEVDILDNVRFPVLQKYFLEKIGFPFPYHPHGLLYLPIPRPRKITVVVGTPIAVIQVDDPSEAIVKELMDRYMNALLTMFERHKIATGERPDRKLVLIEAEGKPYRFEGIKLE